MEKNIDHLHSDFGIKNHIVICNWSSKADIIVRQLHDPSVKNKSAIIVITENPEDVPKTRDAAYRGLLMIAGDPANAEILRRAGISDAKTVIVLSDERDPGNSDSKIILTILAIESINPQVHTIIELNSSKNEIYFKYTHVDEIICLEQLAEKLLSQSALTPGLSSVYMDLLTQSSETNEIYQEDVPKELVNKTYREIEKLIVDIDEKDIIVLGFATTVSSDKMNGKGRKINERKIVINPKSSSEGAFSKSYKLKDGDSIFMVSYTKPDIENYFRSEEVKTK